MRRIVRDVGKDAHQRRARQGAAQALAQRADEVRRQGDHHVRAALAPEFLEHAHLLSMEQADHPVHDRHQLSRPQRPSLLEHEVVHVLQPKPGRLAENVDRIQHLLQVHHADLERARLPVHNLFEGAGRRAVPPAGVEEDEIELLHHSDCAMDTPAAELFNARFSRL
jgi:hypothetical protein